MPTSRPRSSGCSSRSPALNGRRRALAALAGVALLRPPDARAQGGTPRVLAWGERGLWVGHDGDAVATALADDALAAPAPLPQAHGVVAVDGAGRLRTWRSESAHWRERPPLGFDAPVHAFGTSGDGQWTLAAHGQGLSLVDAAGRVQRRWDGRDLAQRARGSAAAIRHLPHRRSFAISWPTLGEWWELQLDPAAAPVYDGLVHDWRMGEGIAAPGYLGIRRAPLGVPAPELEYSDPRVAWLAGRAAGQVAVVHLDVRRRIASFAYPDARVQGAALVDDGAALQWWLPVGDAVQVIDPLRWLPLARHALPAPVRALFARPGAVWAWLDRADGAPLLAWQHGRWQPVAGVPEPLRAAALDARDATLLCASSSEICSIDAQGRLRQRWRVDAAAGLRGLAAFPA